MDLIKSITQRLFHFTEETDFHTLIKDIEDFIKEDINKITIQNIFAIFSFTRPKQKDLLNIIQQSLLIEPKKYAINEKINEIIHINSNDLFKNILLDDNLVQLQNIFTKKLDINDNSNLLESCAYYGAIKCFKFLSYNHFKLSNEIINYAIAGGNMEIINIIINNNINYTFNSLQVSIYFHHYNLYNIIQRYIKEPDIYAAIFSYNFIVLFSSESFIITNISKSEFFYSCCISENFVMLKYFYNKYIDSNINMNEIIWYSCEIQKDESIKKEIISTYIESIINDIAIEDLYNIISFFSSKLNKSILFD